MVKSNVTSESGVYEIWNVERQERYIGSSVNMQDRKYDHVRVLRQGKHHSVFLQRAWDKYGEEAFVFRILEKVPDRTLLVQREQYWIELKHPRYNMNPAATNRLGTKQSEGTIAKLREYNLRPEVVAKKKAELTGHPVAPETIELIKEARAKQETTEGMLRGLAIGWTLPADQRGSRQGQTNSEEQNRKIAEAHTGMKATPEAIKKMRLAKLDKKQDPESVTKRINASWGSKTEEEKAAIIAKRQATMAAKRNQL